MGVGFGVGFVFLVVFVLIPLHSLNGNSTGSPV